MLLIDRLFLIHRQLQYTAEQKCYLLHTKTALQKTETFFPLSPSLAKELVLSTPLMILCALFHTPGAIFANGLLNIRK